MSMPDQYSGELRVMQVLFLPERSIVVDTCDTRVRVFDKRYQTTVQPLERYLGGNQRDDELEVFSVEDPTTLDLLDIFGTDPDKRSSILSWEPGVADVEGCVLLKRPQVLCPSLPLNSPRIPVLSLLDVLLSRGWLGVQKVVEHKPGPGASKTFDDRSPANKRVYYQCVLASVQLFEKGAPAFKSTTLGRCTPGSRRLNARSSWLTTIRKRR